MKGKLAIVAALHLDLWTPLLYQQRWICLIFLWQMYLLQVALHKSVCKCPKWKCDVVTARAVWEAFLINDHWCRMSQHLLFFLRLFHLQTTVSPVGWMSFQLHLNLRWNSAWCSAPLTHVLYLCLWRERGGLKVFMVCWEKNWICLSFLIIWKSASAQGPQLRITLRIPNTVTTNNPATQTPLLTITLLH